MAAVKTEGRDYIYISQPRLGYAAETNSHSDLRGTKEQKLISHTC